jgi:predicted small integral membrane protein
MPGRLWESAARFSDAKRLFYVATGLGLPLWFTGFMTVAGEWNETG